MRPSTRTPGGAAVAALDDAALRSFVERFGGDVLLPDDDEYDDARRVWNGLVNRYPAVIARCDGAADVVAAVSFAREHGLALSVRGGGHNVAGSSVVDGGLVVDCSRMTGIRVDPRARTARVQPGVRVADLLRETQRFGLATSLGTAGDTGVAGSTLGGGISWLRRKYGMGVDNLRSVDVVTADGELLTANEGTNADLFWGVRGAGGALGAVTSLEFDLHPVGPDVATAMVFYPGEAAADVLRSYRAFAASAPDAVTSMAFCTSAPDDADVPDAARGEATVGIMACDAGDAASGTERIRPLRELGEPIVDYSGVKRFLDVHELDATYPHGRFYYWTSLFLESLADDCIDRLFERSERAPSPLSSVTIWQLGGEMGRVDAGATAFPSRDAPFMASVEASWDDPTACADNVAWARDTREALKEFSTGRTYVNFSDPNEGPGDAAREAYGDNYERLLDLKREYDPTNLFRGSGNVGPVE